MNFFFEQLINNLAIYKNLIPLSCIACKILKTKLKYPWLEVGERQASECEIFSKK